MAVIKTVKSGISVVSCLALVACGGGSGSSGGGSGGGPVSLSAPALANISGVQSFTVDEQIDAVVFTNSGGGELSACNAQSLPSGLSAAVSANRQTCSISGTPTEASAEESYSIQGVNRSGNSSATVTIVVEAAAVATPTPAPSATPTPPTPTPPPGGGATPTPTPTPTPTATPTPTPTPTPALQAPDLVGQEDLSFQQFAELEIVLQNAGGEDIDECAADLPEGLVVAVTEDATSCELSGEALEASEEGAVEVIEITASNAAGSSTATVSFEVLAVRPFITRWKTDNVTDVTGNGNSGANQVRIETAPGFTYDFRIDWGDGNVDRGVTEEITHTYDEVGEYDVSITGAYPKSSFGFISDSPKLIEVKQWGDQQWESMEEAFIGCNNMVMTASDAPDLSAVTTMKNMFNNARSFNSDISHWDFSTITDMSLMFLEARSFNQPVNEWDVSNVVNMESMFNQASAFNQNLSSWDISKVENMAAMFVRSGLSTENYDNLLNAWQNLTLQTGVTFDVGDTQFSADGADARDAIINDFNWDINDGGLVAP